MQNPMYGDDIKTEYKFSESEEFRLSDLNDGFKGFPSFVETDGIGKNELISTIINEINIKVEEYFVKNTNVKDEVAQSASIFNSKIPWECLECNRKFVRKGAFERHISLGHTCKGSFTCNVCYRKFKQKTDLSKHMCTHTGERLFRCDKCTFQFKRRGHLKRHILIHNNEKSFACTNCDYTCIRKDQLKRHVHTHNNEKQCYLCNYKTLSVQILWKHMKQNHDLESPGKECGICNHVFRKRGELKRHVRIHSGEKPFKCEICGYKCSRKDSLKVHIRKHTDEKPFACKICGFKCKQRYFLKKHILSHS